MTRADDAVPSAGKAEIRPAPAAAPDVHLNAPGGAPHAKVLEWTPSEAFVSYDVEAEEQSTGHIYAFRDAQPPFAVHEHLPEGYYDTRLFAVTERGRRMPSPLLHFSTLHKYYFEDKNPRPKHVLSMDEGNKFEHSRMFRILNIVPGQALPPCPQVRWLTTVEEVTSFDVVFFNKAKSYWVFLRSIRGTSAIPSHRLEPGAYFIFIKAAREAGQIWSYPLYVEIREDAKQEANPEIVVAPKYMYRTGEYFAPHHVKKHDLSPRKAPRNNNPWLFKPSLDHDSIIGPRPEIKWCAVHGADYYDVFARPEDGSRPHHVFRKLKETRLSPPEPLPPGNYAVSVHAVSVSDGKAVRRVRSAPAKVAVTPNPFTQRYLAARRRAARDLRSEKRFAEHMDAIAGMDYQTNVRLLRWEIEHGVTQLYGMPTRLSALVGYDCNIDCIFCDNGRVPRDIRIPDRYIRDLPHFMRYATVMQVLGGEPLMLKDFRRIVDMAADLPHLRLATTTNGTLVDDRWASYFARSNFEWVWMSVDGATERTYRSMRRGGSLESVVKGVRK
ncbi:MAG: radical SAM protein, partial [Planctomycetota bacterium]